MLSTIRLFRAVLVTNKDLKSSNSDLLKRTIAEGFIFSDTVMGNLQPIELETLFAEVQKELGLSTINSSFHKSWQKVRDSSIEQLVIEQILHYFTTYGFEALGIYDKDSVYVPVEKLEVPALGEGIKLTVINGLTKEELKTKCLDLVNSGIALKEETLKDVIDVLLFVGITITEIEGLKNKEIKSHLYDYSGLVPTNAVEFLRYIVYKATDSALLIKNEKTIEMIKEKKNLDVLGLFEKYDRLNGLPKLAEIFYRFKPIFLAFRTNVGLKKIVNKIRRLAVKNHKPIAEDYLNTVTVRIKNFPIPLDKDSTFGKELEKANVFRKIRLAYALKFRTLNCDSILYKVRNGKGFATDFKFTTLPNAQDALNVVLDSITGNVAEHVLGKKIYIPKNLDYSLPATEKQFTGMLPSGTCVRVPKDMVFGVHWENVGSHRIDLDLSLLSADEKYGWDGEYRNEDKILFSGDMTDAQHGASELFYVKRQEEGAMLMMVNYFNHDESVEVPMKIFVAHEEIGQMQQNYMVDPNNVVVSAQSSIKDKQKVLGVVVTSPTESRFYFSETSIGTSITSSRGDTAEHTRKYLYAFYTNSISLNDILVKAGALMVDDKALADIDLSPETLTKNSILDLLK